jgi:2-iminobutanoate/2-iminopropanoate deaminase
MTRQGRYTVLLPLKASLSSEELVTRIWIVAVVAFLTAPGNPVLAQQVSPGGVKTLSPGGAVKPTGTWNLATRAGDFIFVAGMRGIDPKTNSLVQGDEARVRQAFLNMKLIAQSEGATLQDAVRLVVYVTDMFRHRPLVNKVQEELWGKGPYPPRTIVEIDRLNQDDIVEVEGTFYAPEKKQATAPRRQVAPQRERAPPTPGTTNPVRRDR